MTEQVKMKRPVSPLRRALGVTALVAFLGAGAALGAWNVGRLDAVDMSTLLILCGVVGVVAAATALTYTPGPIPHTGRVAVELAAERARAEQSLSLQLVSNVILGLLWTGFGTRYATEAFEDGDRLWGYGLACMVLLMLCASPAALMGWTATSADGDPDRELNRAFRAQATASGFWALLAVGGAAFLISFNAPELLPSLLPYGLWLGGSVACIHFVWLHRQADRDLRDDG